MKTHKDLDIWKDSITLVNKIYKKCIELPSQEKFGIESQMKRAAVSVPANIAEGAARNHQKEYIRFVYISLGSLSELETLLIICIDNNLLNNCEEVADHITTLRKRMLSFIKYLKKFK